MVGSSESLKELSSRFLGRIKPKLPKGAEAELYLSRGRERGVEMRDGKVESMQESCDEGLGLRIFLEGRGAFACAAGITEENLDKIISQSLAQLPHAPADPCKGLPSPEESPGVLEGGELDLKDPSLLQEPLENQLPRLREMESAALASDSRVRRVLRIGYGESGGEAVIANTLGILAGESGTYCSVGLSVIAEKGDQVQLGSGSSSGRFYKDLDFMRAAKDGARRAGVLIDSKKLPTGRRSVLFDPWVAGEFLEVVAGALSADEVQRGKSLFAGKLGRPVASPWVHLIDDPRMPRGAASSRYDDEGVPTRRKALIEGGELKDYFYDTYTARKDRRLSNGCASRSSYRGLPGPSYSNFYLKPGSISRARLLEDTRDGILVFEVMGMHMTDPISGEFSVGVSGIAIENGVLTHGVRGAMLSGNILEMLNHVDAVSDDLVFYGRLAAPTFRIPDMALA